MSNANPVPSKIIPNTFQTPNLFTDDGLMALLSGSETKCYIVVIRKTFGWRKERDRIAKSQIATATGLNENTVDDCMAALVKFGLILQTARNNAANEGNEWAPQMDDSLINIQGLQERLANAKSANSKRTEKARLSRGRVVGQPPPANNPPGGVVGQPPQQPITASSSIVINAGSIFKIYEEEFGGLTAMIRDLINDSIDTYPIEWIPDAIEIAVSKNIRTWDYVEGILKKCKEKNIRPSLSKLEANNGNYGKGNKKGSGPKQQTSKPDTVESDSAKLVEINKRRREKRHASVQ